MSHNSYFFCGCCCCCHAGLLAASTLQPLLQHILAMPLSREGWSPATLALHNVDQLMRMWDHVVIATPKMQPLAVRNALPLLQQVQSSTRLLSATAGTPAAAAAAAANRSLPRGMLISGRRVNMGYVVTKPANACAHTAECNFTAVSPGRVSQRQ
jgi:hypothetical protein